MSNSTFYLVIFTFMSYFELFFSYDLVCQFWIIIMALSLIISVHVNFSFRSNNYDLVSHNSGFYLIYKYHIVCHECNFFPGHLYHLSQIIYLVRMSGQWGRCTRASSSACSVSLFAFWARCGDPLWLWAEAHHGTNHGLVLHIPETPPNHTHCSMCLQSRFWLAARALRGLTVIVTARVYAWCGAPQRWSRALMKSCQPVTCVSSRQGLRADGNTAQND